ncbi:MAG: hypothetical protein BMS9Abin29_2570 [Gemmatimonadota bacterium]|nr:MAG: hypothetical protein BMS9Abin29_2570 [Gemmatimonadota bacterium]
MSDLLEQPRLAVESIAGLRPYQEDAVLSETLPDGRTLIAVADGMGGHAAGEVASALALETLSDAVKQGQALDDAFRLANERVNLQARDPGKLGMGTTLVAMLLDGDSYQIANVGDSRCYVVDGDGARRITEDHSFVTEAIKRGQSEDQAMASQWKDVLTRCIGTEAEVEVDLFGPFHVDPDTAILLCSDGLHKVLSDEDLSGIFANSGGPRGAAQSLVANAYEAGSDDNISVVIAEFGEVPRDRPAGTIPIEYDPPDEADAPEAPASQAGPTPSAAAASGSEVHTRSRSTMAAIVTVVVLVVVGVIAFVVLGG